MDEAQFVADNVRALREKLGFTQKQCADLAGMPRPTWALLESGGANPTLRSLTQAAAALQVSVQELIEAPRSGTRLFRAAELPRKSRRGVDIQALLPDGFIGTHMERLTLDPGAVMGGVPHTDGTREYLICDRGQMEIRVAGEQGSAGI